MQYNIYLAVQYERSVLIVLIAVVGCPANGWFFESDRIDPHTEVTNECLNHAAWGTCEFYSCLEQRFPCGHSGFAYYIGLHFCEKTVSQLGQLDESGLTWVNGTARCLSGHLLPLYQSPFQRCDDIREYGAQAIVECNDRVGSDGTDFCWFVRENSQFYESLFDTADIIRIIRLRSPRVLAKMVTEAVRCGATTLQDRASSFTTSVSDFFQNVVAGINDLVPWD